MAGDELTPDEVAALANDLAGAPGDDGIAGIVERLGLNEPRPASDEGEDA